MVQPPEADHFHISRQRYCKDMDYDVKNIYTKTMMNKFSWAEDTGKNYWKKCF